MVDVTVVIPTFNNAGTIRATLEAVMPQAAEVIVVDDGSTDGTDRIAQDAGATLVRATRRSAAHARNLGWAQARHDVVLFTDSDAAPRPDWAERLRRAFDDPDVLVAGGAIDAVPGTRFARLYHRMYLAIDAKSFHDGSAYLPGMNLGVRRSLYERVHFRDDLPGAQCEDVDFELRAARMGIRVRYVPDAIVRHHQPSNFDELVEQELRHGEGRARLVALHPELRRAWHTDRWWKWLAMSTLGAGAHVLYALRLAKRIDPPLLVLHVLRMGVGDYGFLRGSRKLRAAAHGGAP